MAGEENRHQMMQNLFGDQSEEEDEEEEVESEHESNRQVAYASDEGDGGPELEGEGEGEVEGQGEAGIESEGEPLDVDVLHGESEGEKSQSSQEVEIGDQREESEERYLESDDEGYGQRVVTSRRRNTIDSGSEGSGENYFIASKDEEVNQGRSYRSPDDDKNEDHLLHSAPEIRDVFGDSDDEEQEEYAVQNQIEDENRSPVDEEETFEKELRPEDMILDEDAPYESEEEHAEARPKEKPVGPPLELEIPLRRPPADPDKMHMIKVSNIMGIDPKPFDPKTYVEEDVYVTDESGSKKRIRLENNIVRWRRVKNPDGTTSVESNARIVEWSDGSLQLLIGNEVLDISKQDAQHEQAHLFLRHGKGILQSQGRILTKMKFMPSSLTSNSHRLLTALVDSRHKKVYKVKNCITDIDPEREKEQKEKAVSQSIRASALLSRKKEKVKSKYTQPNRRERQLSPGFLEDALDEDDEQDYYEPRRSAARRSFEEDLEMEARAEKRIINAKKGPNDITRKSALPSRRSMDFSESEKEESEYETEGEEDEGSPSRRRNVEVDQDYEEEDEGHEQGGEDEAYEESEEEAEEPKQKARQSGGSLKRKDIESDEDSPPRKAATHRRMAIVYDSDEE
ncbi:LEO1 homolog isoform X1 [Olea europaea subsp. europaea]|uniref:LEO1 homolog isoform X1 n=1 Tax=Olea europaea subsp. europaea TaxID=158383 RepID=A0A8S0UVE0_OLEEU|nr:LEO1 homolog isoform X1 [Olea europaea subsp. europaea]